MISRVVGSSVEGDTLTIALFVLVPKADMERYQAEAEFVNAQLGRMPIEGPPIPHPRVEEVVEEVDDGTATPLEKEILHILREAAGPLTNQQIIRTVHHRKQVKNVGKSHVNQKLYLLRGRGVLSFEQDAKGNKLWKRVS
jgi:hypothetical protein